MKNKGLISEDNHEYLIPMNTTIGHLYLLPKIHKKGIPGRSIGSSVTQPTAKISQFVDAHIKKYVPQTQSYIRDTQDFISKIKPIGPLPEGAFLVTLDPTKQGISTYILELLKLVLHSMYFEFNGDFYLQVGGTAMDMALAPNYANLFMDKFRTKTLEQYPLKPLIWKRFIDDIFMIWTHGEQELHKFVEYLNSIHPTIKFTLVQQN